VLGHSRNYFFDIFQNLLVGKIVNTIRHYFKRLSHGQNSKIMCVHHFFVFFTCQESYLFRIVQNLFTVVNETSMNDLEVGVEEFVIKESS
jgi:hypothetical protein